MYKLKKSKNEEYWKFFRGEKMLDKNAAWVDDKLAGILEAYVTNYEYLLEYWNNVIEVNLSKRNMSINEIEFLQRRTNKLLRYHKEIVNWFDGKETSPLEEQIKKIDRK